MSTQQSQPQTRTEILAQLHKHNPFGGYNNSKAWEKVPTEKLLAALHRWQAK